jgi:hypothetical protein
MAHELMVKALGQKRKHIPVNPLELKLPYKVE